MFLEVFRFEFRQQLRSALFPAVAAVFFLLAFLAMASENVTVGGVGSNLNLNASFAIIATHYSFSFIAMFAAAAFAATSITRDFERRTAEIMFATGVGRLAFFFGRFAGGALTGFLAACVAVAGTLVATFMPWLDADRLGAFSWAPYWYSIWAVMLPNMLIASAVFFAVSALTRSMFAAYGAALALVVLRAVAVANTDAETISTTALLDPFGAVAHSQATRYWTVFERNGSIPAMSGSLAASRTIWMGVALGALAVAAFFFSTRLPKPHTRRRTSSVDRAPPVQGSGDLVATPRRFDSRSVLAQFWSQLSMELHGIARSIPFYVLLAFGVANVSFSFVFSLDQIYGTPILPVTRAILDIVGSSFVFLVYVIIIYYGGELLHRESQTGVSAIVDAAPFPSGVMTTAKVAALWFVAAVLLAVVGGTGMIVQVFNDYHEFELPLYVSGLYMNFGWEVFLLCVLSVFVQTLAANKWLGMLAVLVLLVGLQTLSSFGFEHRLYQFGVPTAPYSDMNGYGHYLQRLVTVGAYWTAFTVLLAVAAHLVHRRGGDTSIPVRWSVGRHRFTPAIRSVTVIGLASWVGLGIWIFHNTNVLNAYEVEADVEALQASYEKRFKQYAAMAKPEAVSLDLEVDIYPDERRLESRGVMLLTNPHDVAIHEIHLHVRRELTVTRLDVPGEWLAPAESTRYRRYRLHKPLPPSQALKVGFDLSWLNVGFENARSTTRVVENGTFVDSTQIVPFIGYDPTLELTDNNKRRKHGLPPVERLPKYSEIGGRELNQFGVATRSRFRALLSTSLDQTAIAPGYLTRDWKENGRRYLEYQMDEPIWPFVSFQSARYAVERDRWNDVELEVFYHPEHAYNVGAMIDASKKSLEYFTREFSPYQFRQFRILEFPSYASFAQSFPNTVPYSEAIGFIADLRDDGNIDYVFYVTAHEMAHQWWAHQVIGARMQGATALVETLAQYSALMVMEHEYGEARMRRFLKYELDRYLADRGSEQIEELPLKLVENQGYIHYGKGSVVMYALKDAMGEAAVNRALRDLIERFGDRAAPFPTSGDLIAALKKEGGERHHKLIYDLFERISVFDLKIAKATVDPREDGRYEVEVTVEARQFEANGDGREREVPMRLELDLAVFPASGGDLAEDDLPSPLHLEKRLFRSGRTTFKFTVDRKPAKVAIDPYHKMIDRNPDDNLRGV